MRLILLIVAVILVSIFLLALPWTHEYRGGPATYPDLVGIQI